jgi:hypothetical protein
VNGQRRDAAEADRRTSTGRLDENGVERASRGAPREIDEIETLMKESAPAAAGRRPDIIACAARLERDTHDAPRPA